MGLRNEVHNGWVVAGGGEGGSGRSCGSLGGSSGEGESRGVGRP